MKFLPLFAAVFIPLLCSAVCHSETILITTYGPFMGNSKNATGVLAKEVKRRLELEKDLDIKVEICELPVLYDKGAEVGKKCYEGLTEKPKMVFSLGQNEFSREPYDDDDGCNISTHTQATNFDDSRLPDNAGVLRREKQKILPGEPDQVEFTVPIQSLLKGVPYGYPNWAGYGGSMRNYVCNNNAFILATYFRDKNVEYTFIHTAPPPPAECGLKGAPEYAGKVLSGMIGSAIKESRKRSPLRI